MNSDLGAWIRDSRKARKWNQTQVGKMLGVSQAYVSELETGKRLPTAEDLRVLEIACGEAPPSGGENPAVVQRGDHGVSRSARALLEAPPLPERHPQVGELVQVRSRRWLVEDVTPPPKPGQTVKVLLACADDDALGQSLEVFWDYEPEEKRELESNIRSWGQRLKQFDRDLESEPGRIREFYEVRARRVEPVGLVCLWPETN